VETFSQLYAAQTGTPPAAVERQLLQCCLYPHARLLLPLLIRVTPQLFAADIDMIHDVAQLTDPEAFDDDAYAHRHHPAAGGIWRRAFHLRLSTQRLHRLVRAAFRRGAERSPKDIKTCPAG